MVEVQVDKKFTDILRVICICNDIPMLKNQRMVSSAILDDDDRRATLLMNLKRRDGVLSITSPWAEVETWIPLVDLQKESKSRDDGKYYEFYCSLIFLLSDLCQNRNYLTIKTVRSYFPLDICIDIIVSKEYKFMLRSAFSKLILTLWIDVSPFIQQKIPSNLKIWEEIGTTNQLKITSTNHDWVNQYKKLVEFIFEFLKNEEIETKFDEKGEFFIQLVKLVQMMLSIGFFQECKMFKDLFDHLYEIIKKTDKVFWKKIGASEEEVKTG